MKFPAFEPIDFKGSVAAILEVFEISISQITPNSKQPRKKFDPLALDELAESIKKYGIIQPILVKEGDNNTYQIIAGERRWRAASKAGLKKIPAIVQHNDEKENIAISLIENVQREELNPIELAEALYELHVQYSLSHEAIGCMVGKSRATVTNLLRLLNLTPEVRDMVIAGKLEIGHAKALLALLPDRQVFVAKKIIDKKLSVRNAEKLVQNLKATPNIKENPYTEEISDWVYKLSKTLSTQVVVKINEKGEGTVVIPFLSPEEVDWLLERLGA